MLPDAVKFGLCMSLHNVNLRLNLHVESKDICIHVGREKKNSSLTLSRFMEKR